jgi:hypothetical protein
MLCNFHIGYPLCVYCVPYDDFILEKYAVKMWTWYDPIVSGDESLGSLKAWISFTRPMFEPLQTV